MTTPTGSKTTPAPADPPKGSQPNRLRRVWGVLGPSLVTGASDDDPSGIATYTQAGAQFGFGLLWTALMFAVITATASTLGMGKGTDITSAAQAAGALKPIAGSLASTLFALGFIGSGMLAVPVLAGAGSVGLAGLLGKPWGLSLSPRKAPLFYVLLTVGTLGGTALTLASVNPISLLVLVAIVNGIAAAPFLIVVMIISRNRPLMGESRNQGLAAVLGWGTVALMTIAAVAMLALLTGL
jgi:Mn2+/Fe2+ NRAMP family transporter